MRHLALRPPLTLFSTALLVLWSAIACSSDDDAAPEAPLPTDFSFSDGFETDGQPISALLPSDGSRWTSVQLVNPVDTANELSLATSPVRSGEQSLRVLAKASAATLSKAGIEKAGFGAPAGSTVTIRASFYIDSEADLEDLFLLDLECCSCWDPTVPDNQCPGVRLTLKRGDYLAIERGKILGSTLRQTVAPVPRGTWFELEWEMTLSPDADGANTLRLDGMEVLSAATANMPNADTLREAFARSGVDFTLQEPVRYERFQIGATANSTVHDVVLYVDDVELVVRE